MVDVWADNYLDDPDVRGIVIGFWDVTEAGPPEGATGDPGAAAGDRGPGGHRHRRPGTGELLEPGGGAALRVDAGRGPRPAYRRPDPDRRESTPGEDILRDLAEGGRWSGELTLRRKDGSTFLASVANTPILDEAGRTRGIIGVSSDISHLKRTEAALRERLKEMGLLVQASQIIRESDVPLEKRLRRLVEAVPGGWLHPEVTEARIVLGERTVATPGFRETPWALSAPIPMGGEPPGRLDVTLTEERPEQDQGPFLREEVDLIGTLTKMLGGAVERERAARLLTRRRWPASRRPSSSSTPGKAAD